MIKQYRIFVRKPLPSNLRERVTALHVSAVLKSRNKGVSVDVKELDSHNCEVTIKGDNNRSLRESADQSRHGNGACERR